MDKNKIIQQNIQQIKSEIEKYKTRALRQDDNVDLIAVSKTFPIDDIKIALDTGHRIFGENKVQECRDKWIDLKSEYQNIELHLIGGLQTNKVKYLPNLVDVIHTLDNIKLANEIKKHIDKNENWNPQIYIQVNTGAEAQKNGVLEQDADKIITQCKEMGLNIVGLMCIPPADENPSVHFALLRKIAMRNNLQKLSMGMSTDYPIAIDLGATCVRIGSAIFGARG
ncbi:MAG: YggS family pyridoxal phosphate-dependent enzyme [Alphaproteobacteria bacterium]|nr:YggS family pyridoxal phosphate-dependent enzyme [Alphaproteobacteria bacterium]